MPIIDANQLTHAQRRVMQYLARGHTARRQYGSVVYVNGGKIATVATMIALERRKLVSRNGDEWKAVPLDEPRRYCPNCRASITDTDVEAGACTQCGAEV